MTNQNSDDGFTKTIILLISILIINNIPIYNSQLVNECPNGEDYSPCTCSSSSGDIVITCDSIPLDQIQDVFKRTSPVDVYQLKLTFNSLDTSGIPSEFLVNKRFERIDIYCPSSDDQFLLKVDQDAFRSSNNYTEWLQLRFCEMQRFDFTFMAGFTQFTSLSLRSCSNIHLASWATFPALPELYLFDVFGCTGLGSWTNFPFLGKGLKEVYLQSGSDLDDVSLSRILSQWLLINSKTTLETLYLSNNIFLTRIPDEIGSFSSLITLAMYFDNLGPVVQSGSLVFNAPVRLLYLYGNYIKEIEDGAFGGDYSNGFINMVNNQITRFDENVFKTMLEQMVGPLSKGILLISENPFDCTTDHCHLSWLIRDNRNLLPAFDTFYPPRCSNGTYFSELNPDGYVGCPIKQK